MMYKALFQVRIFHGYYTKGYAKDFSIQPCEQTSVMLRRHRMLFREVENGFDVLIPMANETDPLIAIGSDMKMSIALFLKNSSFPAFSDIAAKTSFDQIYFLNNLMLGETLELPTTNWKLVQTKARSFNYSLESEATDIRLKITDPFGVIVFNDSMKRSGASFSHLVDIGSRVTGKYSFEATIDGVVHMPVDYFLSDDLNQKRPFAVLDFFSSELSLEYSTHYTLTFNPSKAQWKYLVTLGKDYTGNTLFIKDTKDEPTVAFKLTRNEVLTKGSTVSFESVNIADQEKVKEITFSEAPIADFDLIIKRNDNGDEIEIKKLPNPSILNLNQEIHITI